MMCQQCWDEAFLIAEARGMSQAIIYNQLIVSRPVTFHAEKCSLSQKDSGREIYSQPVTRSQKKRRTKGE